MQQFDLFFAYVPFLDANDGKNRPVLLLKLSASNDNVMLAPIYSYKKWFDDDLEAQNILYEIQDLLSAGLTKRSFVDVSRVFSVSKKDFTNKTMLGHLSDLDIMDLLEKLGVRTISHTFLNH